MYTSKKNKCHILKRYFFDTELATILHVKIIIAMYKIKHAFGNPDGGSH